MTGPRGIIYPFMYVELPKDLCCVKEILVIDNPISQERTEVSNTPRANSYFVTAEASCASISKIPLAIGTGMS